MVLTEIHVFNVKGHWYGCTYCFNFKHGRNADIAFRVWVSAHVLRPWVSVCVHWESHPWVLHSFHDPKSLHICSTWYRPTLGKRGPNDTLSFRVAVLGFLLHQQQLQLVQHKSCYCCFSMVHFGASDGDSKPANRNRHCGGVSLYLPALLPHHEPWVSSDLCNVCVLCTSVLSKWVGVNSFCKPVPNHFCWHKET